MRYPQVLPTSWALVYVLQHSTLQFVPHGMMTLFPLGIGALLFDLGLRRQDPTYHLAAAITTFALAGLVGEWMASGHADVPVAFLALLALYPLLVVDPRSGPHLDRSRLLLCALAAACAALTKQAGLYVVAVLPAFVWLGLPHLATRARLAASGGVAALAIALLAPWYVYVELRIQRGLEYDEGAHVARVADAFGGPPRALEIWQQAWSEPFGYAAIALVLASLLRREGRRVTLLVSLPFTALWALRYAYDARNLALAIPFLGLSVAHGAGLVADRLSAADVGRRATLRIGVAVVAALTFAAALADIDAGRLAERGEEQWIQIEDPVFNTRLLEYLRSTGRDGQILSEHRYLLSHPELRERFFVDRSAPLESFWPFKGNGVRFAGVVEDRSNEIRYILLLRDAKPGIMRYIREGLREGRFEVVVSGERGRLLRVAESRP
jgi:hypothetical protein